MKRLLSFLTAASILLLSSACTSSNETDLSDNTETTASSTEATAANAEETTGNTSETTTDTESAANTAETIYNGEYKIFKGVPKAENTINTVNCKEIRPSLLCYGGGNTFFMWDGIVYKYSEDKTEPLFEKNAYNLNYYNGKLYFIENDEFDIYSEDRLGVEGCVHSYDLETGEFRQLTDFPVAQLIVTEKGIFYTDCAVVGDPEPTGIFRIDEKTGESERLYDGLNYIEYGDYRLKYNWSGDGNPVLCFFNDKEEYFLNNIDQPYRECINGDYYYFYAKLSQSNNFLNRLSMLTGEITSLKPYKSTARGTIGNGLSNFCFDFTVLNDVIYFIDDYSQLRMYDEASDSYPLIECEYYSFSHIYSDDKYIYGVGSSPLHGSTRQFVKLSLDGTNAQVETLA